MAILDVLKKKNDTESEEKKAVAVEKKTDTKKTITKLR